MKLTSNLTQKYKENFKEILLPLGFIIKGSLFIRVTNNEIIQTINIFKKSPFDFTLNIGIFPFSRDNDKSLLKEGSFRLYDFGDYDSGEFRYNPLSIKSIQEELEKCKYQFKKEILPIFESVQTEEDFLKFEIDSDLQNYGEIRYMSDEKLHLFLKFKNYEGALKVVEAYINQNISAIIDNHRSEFDSEDKFQIFLNSELKELNELKKAIESNDTNFLNHIVLTKIENTKTMLNGYGYKF
ncbi:hypothetical protein [Gottfriedia solisilvae]|uniref:Uncharacterized protein n=1 Tax=Gottfriedia solisilvae TaxID=1516104 RepID=A0A8J3AL91_9BACI|nr:hypothetical protein [Gottfriedia solisilvae]GGI12977.1 hypothetical protein GCM10007380_15610 [Gottfriedia solisilvae]